MTPYSAQYDLIRFKSSSDEGFIEALRIYQQSIPHEQKTNSSEIVYWIDHSSDFKCGELFFFGLRLNGLIVGYAELAYIKKSRAILIDYITLDTIYKTNSGFYTFYALIINYINDLSIDYDFITKEILCRHNEIHIQKEDVNLYELENFKVINSLYIQPQLESNNIESKKDALVMIYMRAISCLSIQKEAYMNIISIIYDYYYIWDYPFSSDDERFQIKTNSTLYKKIILDSIEDNMIKLNGYPFKYSSNGSGIIVPIKKNSNFVFALISVLIIVAIIMGILFVLKILDYEPRVMVFTGGLVVMIFLLLLIILDRNTLNVLKKIPIFSKVYELLK